MSSSLHFADDFLRTEIEKEQADALHKSIQDSFHGSTTTNDDMDMEGLQVLTKVIDKMMSRVKIDIIDTLIRIIHQSAVPLTNAPDNEYHLDICIPRISYFDETPEFNTSNTTESTHNNLMESSILMPPVANETIKIITLASPEIWLRSAANAPDTPSPTGNTASRLYSIPTQSETTINQNLDDSDENDDDFLNQTEFFEANQGNSSLFQSQYKSFNRKMSGSITPKANTNNYKPYEALLFTTMDKKNWIRIKLRSSIDSVSFLSVKQIDFWITNMRAIISPQQIAFFMDMLDAMTTPSAPQEEKPRKSSTELKCSKKTTEMNLLDDLDSFNTDSTTLTPSTPAFNMANSSSLLSSLTAATPSAQNIPERKIKLQISLVELFLLGDDEPVRQWSKPGLNKNHLRFAIQQLNLRLQQFPNHQQQKHKLSSIMEMRIANVIFDEWIVRPPQAKNTPFSARSQTKYNVYNPIFQFDNRIKQDYHPEEHFPVYNPLQSHTDKSPQQQQQQQTTEAIRIRIEKKQNTRESGGRFSVEEGISFEEDITIDIPAFKLQLDPCIIDRIENYIHAIGAYNKLKEEQLQQDGSLNNPHKTNREPRFVYDVLCEIYIYLIIIIFLFCRPSVYDDLQSHENIQKRKVRVRCAFIRIFLFAPDMSQINTREEFNDQFHDSQLSIDIKKLAVTWNSTTTVIDDALDNEDYRPTANKSSRSSSNNNINNNSNNKLNVELNFVNVFMHLKNDEMVRCWFTAKTMQESSKIFTTDGTLSPTIEITIQDAQPFPYSDTSSSGRSGFFGAGSNIIETLFKFLEKNENFNSEQKVHIPMDEQSESAMMFKQRTIETSVSFYTKHKRLILTKYPESDICNQLSFPSGRYETYKANLA